MNESFNSVKGSNGNWILSKELERAIRGTYVKLSTDVVEEDKYLTILRKGEYTDEERKWLENRFEPLYFELINKINNK